MKINFESSTSCNAKCVFCPRYDMTRKGGQMSDELFHKIIKDGKEAGIYRYSPFMNGEPFVFSKIWEWLDYMEKEGVKVSLYTNAEFIDVERIVKYKNIEYISCSINASIKETYDKVMRGPDFDKCVRNTRELIEKAPFFVRASFVRCDENKHEEEEFRKMFRKTKVCGFANWTGARTAEIERKGKKSPCNVLMTQLFILWNGDVVPCCMDYDGKQILGNVKYNTIKEIRNNASWLRAKHNSGDFDTFVCRNCNYNTIQ